MTRTVYKDWDGQVSRFTPSQFPIVRNNISQLFGAIQNLMMDKIKVEMFFTIFDPRRDYEEFNTEWSHVEIIIKSKQEQIFYFLRKAVYYDKKKDIAPCTNEANMLIKEMQHFCGITTVAEESDGNTLSAKELQNVEWEFLKINDLPEYI